MDHDDYGSAEDACRAEPSYRSSPNEGHGVWGSTTYGRADFEQPDGEEENEFGAVVDVELAEPELERAGRHHV